MGICSLATHIQDWPLEYLDEIHSYLRTREKDRIEFKSRLLQIHDRNTLVQDLIYLTGIFKLSQNALHLSVYMLDIFMDNHIIPEKDISLVGLCCLSIGIKTIEVSYNVRMNELNKFTCHTYKLNRFIEMESIILCFFSWNLLVPTLSTFIDYYITYCFEPNELHLNRKLVSKFANGVDELKNLLQTSIRNLINIVISDVRYLSYSPSLLAASCIAFSRKFLTIRPMWSNQLRQTTGYRIAQLISCIKFIDDIVEYEDE